MIFSSKIAGEDQVISCNSRNPGLNHELKTCWMSESTDFKLGCAFRCPSRRSPHFDNRIRSANPPVQAPHEFLAGRFNSKKQILQTGMVWFIRITLCRREDCGRIWTKTNGQKFKKTQLFQTDPTSETFLKISSPCFEHLYLPFRRANSMQSFLPFQEIPTPLDKPFKTSDLSPKSVLTKRKEASIISIHYQDSIICQVQKLNKPESRAIKVHQKLMGVSRSHN